MNNIDVPDMIPEIEDILLELGVAVRSSDDPENPQVQYIIISAILNKHLIKVYEQGFSDALSQICYTGMHSEN